MGGTLRQAGVIAAPGLVALRSLIPRLAEDHENARVFAERVEAMDGLSVDLRSVESNIINVDVAALGIDAATFAAHLDQLGVRGLPGMGTVVRFVTYRNIGREHILQALEVIGDLLEESPWTDGQSTT